MTATDTRTLSTVHALHQAGQVLGQNNDATLFFSLQLLMVPLAAWRPRVAMALVAALGVVQCVLAWPRTGNHLFLGVLVSVLLALLDGTEREERLQLERSLLAMVLLSFVWSGVHKLVHGAWFQGETLAWLMVSRADVAAVLRPFLSDAEALQLSLLNRAEEGSGPFRLSGAWLLVSNAVWVFELLLAALWHPKLRSTAHRVLLPAVWLVQLVAHEWEFALLLTTMLLLRVRARWAYVATALGIVLLMLVRLGVVHAPWWAMHAPEPLS